MYYSRAQNKMCEESAPADKKLNFLYKTVRGRILLKTVFARRWFSFLVGRYYTSVHTGKKLKRFIGRHPELSAYNYKDFKSFNDFFTREEERHCAQQEGVAISPADGLVMCFDIDSGLTLSIKGAKYSLQELLQDAQLAQKYIGGRCFIYRLTLLDYHRYSYIDDGEICSTKYIKGALNTVRPMGTQKDSYFKNSRCVSVFATKNFGTVANVEVGAMLVGKIKNHKSSGAFVRMEERGYFEYGGSTVIQLFEKGKITPCSDINNMSAQGVETKISTGEIIGNA